MSETTVEYDESQYDPHAEPQWSEGGHYWWDGGKWITAAEREAALAAEAEAEAARAQQARERAERARAERARAAQEKAAQLAAARAQARAEREAAAEAERIAAAEAEVAQARAAQQAAHEERERAEEAAHLKAATEALAAERRAAAARAKQEQARVKQEQARVRAEEARAKQEQARAAAVPDVAETAPTPARHRLSTRTRVVLALVLASLVGAGLAVAAANNGPATPKLPGGDAGTSLAAAGQAEQRFYDKHNRYTASILDLTPVGYRPTKGVTLTVLHADGGTYCLSASQGSAVYYLSSADLLISRTPCS